MTSIWQHAGWNLQLSVPPQLDPLTLEEAKRQVRVEFDFTDDDDYLRTLMLAVKDWAEGETSKALLTQTLVLRLDRFPYGSRIYLPRPPLQSVTSVVYLDINNVSQTLSSSNYQVVGARTTPDQHAPCGFIQPVYSAYWPVTYPVPESVTITYLAGWTTVEAVPQRIKQAMLLMLGDLYENRERTIVGSNAAVMDATDMLLTNEICRQEFNF